MGRVKFNLQLKVTHPPKKHWQKRKNKAYCQVAHDRFKEKQAQISKAVEWCQENGKRGWAALKTGQFPLVGDVKTINRRLDGDVTHDEEKSYCSILTNDEEVQVVRHIKNRNRCLQGLNRAEITTLIIHVLKVRQLGLQKFHGRKLKPLSNAAKKVMESNRLSKSFWKRWDAKHSSITRKRPGNVNLNRALNCTQAMAEEHLDQLADEMQRLRIFTDARHVAPGVWEGKIDTSRVINHDETPQFINYGVDGSASALLYAGKGDECKKLLRENRECVTIDPFVTLSGTVPLCHIIFKGSGITSHMASEKAAKNIDGLFISTTENGVQDHKSLLAVYKHLDTVITKRGIEKPVLLLSDGHT